MRKTLPVARRVLGENNEGTLAMRKIYAAMVYDDPDATLDDLREAADVIEDTARIARRVLGNTHPMTKGLEQDVSASRAELRDRETSPPPGSA